MIAEPASHFRREMNKLTRTSCFVPLLLSVGLSAASHPGGDHPQCQPAITTFRGQTTESLCHNQLIFEQNFSLPLDPTVWAAEQSLFGSAGGQFQWNTNASENAHTIGGLLHIRPTLTSPHSLPNLTECDIRLQPCKAAQCSLRCNSTHWAPPVKSAHLHTRDSFTFRYGRLAVRAKLPTGDWLRPAIRLLPRNTSLYGQWPRSGRLDLLESRGNVHWQPHGVRWLRSGVHVGTESWNDQADRFGRWTQAGSWHRQFHEFELLWTPEMLRFRVDGRERWSLATNDGFFDRGQFGGRDPWEAAGGGRNAPFDQEFSIEILLAVGGTDGYFSDTGHGPYPKPWSDSMPTNRAAQEFWRNRAKWLRTWALDDDYTYLDEEQNSEVASDGEDDEAGMDLAFIVDYVRVYAV